MSAVWHLLDPISPPPRAEGIAGVRVAWSSAGNQGLVTPALRREIGSEVIGVGVQRAPCGSRVLRADRVEHRLMQGQEDIGPVWRDAQRAAELHDASRRQRRLWLECAREDAPPKVLDDARGGSWRLHAAPELAGTAVALPSARALV